ncbi:hypothetical protein AGR1C_Cc20015 [Agrobacterium fabacearum TT111]|nr:hypothetical protein AGR1C_Cc20015 [Agrobacterium fabacearum TT111]
MNARRGADDIAIRNRANRASIREIDTGWIVSYELNHVRRIFGRLVIRRLGLSGKNRSRQPK